MPRLLPLAVLVPAALALPGAAHAVSLADVRCAEQPGNVLRYDCVATTTGAASVRIKFWQDGTADYRYSAASPSGTDHTFTIWGLKGGTRYRYQAEVGGVDDPTIRSFTTDALDAEFGAPFEDLSIRTSTRPAATPWTNYVLVNVTCGNPTQYYLIIDRDGDVVWYEGPDPNRGITAFNITPENTIIGITASRRLHEIALDGTRLQEVDYGAGGECDNGAGPCPHHDIIRDSGNIWAVTSRVSSGEYPAPGLSGCEDKDDFVIDGYSEIPGSPWAIGDRWDLATDYGYTPEADMGPNFDPANPTPKCSPNSWKGTLGAPNGTGGYDPPIDYTHVNAFHVEGDNVWVSIFNWDHIIKTDAPSRTLLWRFHGTNPDYSDFATPVSVAPSIVENNTSTIEGHHHLFTNPDGSFQMYNNQQNPNYTRVLRMDFDEVSMVATINEAWTMVNDDNGSYANPSPLTCTQVGSAYNLGDSSRVLAPCASLGTVAELDRNDGTWTDGPVWYMAVQCAGRPVGPPDFYRAIPIDSLDP